MDGKLVLETNGFRSNQILLRDPNLRQNHYSDVHQLLFSNR